jgi:glycosyltransferase involved in cell wall biosynthesis
MLDYDINPPWTEAVRILAYELSRQLVKGGHSVHVVTSAAPSLPLEEELDGIFFHRISKKLFLSYFLARKVKKLHEIYRFDIIHIQNALMKKSFIITLLLLRKWVRVPMITYICLQPTTSPRDLIQVLRLKKPRESFSRLAGWLVGTLMPKFFVRKELRMVDKIVTSSNYLKTIIMHIGIEPERIDTIYPFINIQEFASSFNHTDFREDFGISKDTPLMLYVGSTEPVRLGSFLKAFPLVLNEIPDSKVVLVSPFTKEFFNLIVKLGLQHAFILLPQHMKINMSRLMATSDVFVYPGFSAIASVDPPLTMIEAMTLGVSIVASNRGGVSEIVRDYENCFLVEPFDYKGMANALIKLLKKTSVNFRSERVLRAVHLQSKFESRSATRHFISIYKHLLNNKAASMPCK